MADGFPIAPVGLGYTDVSVPALSAAQAAGTAPVLADDPNRRGLKIMPPSDCSFAIAPGSAGGMPLYGEISNDFQGGECPTNALYIVGLPANAKVMIWRA